MGEEDKILFPNYKIKELEKKFNDLRVAHGRIRERLLMMETKINKIQSKKEVDYVKLIESLLEKLVTSKDKQFDNYIEVIKGLIKKE